MNFIEWGKYPSHNQSSPETDSHPGSTGQAILAALAQLGGESSLGLLKDATGLSYSELELELGYLRTAALVESDFSSKEAGSYPVLVYRLKNAKTASFLRNSKI